MYALILANCKVTPKEIKGFWQRGKNFWKKQNKKITRNYCMPTQMTFAKMLKEFSIRECIINVQSTELNSLRVFVVKIEDYHLPKIFLLTGLYKELVPN